MPDMSLRASSRARCGAWATPLALIVAGCSDFSPTVGSLQTAYACVAGDASGGGYGYGAAPTASTACVDAGPDTGTNRVVAGTGVEGNVVIADQLNNRVVVIDRTGAVTWSFGDGSGVAGPWSVVAPNDAEYLPTGEVLIAGTGIPAGSQPPCPTDASGCPDDRVLIVDVATENIVWTYGGHARDPGSGSLSGPSSAVLVPTPTGDHVLISDQGNARVVEIDRASHAQQWQYPLADGGAGELTSPQSAERLPNGNTLIADQGGNVVIEVTPAGTVVWQYPEIVNIAALDFPSFASRLPDGHTLITDSNNDRILEIDQAKPGNIVWSYLTASRTPLGNTAPTAGVRLANGHTLVTEIAEDQIVEVDHASPPNVVYWHGSRGRAGALQGELNQPYVAKVVGDFTGLTSPQADAGTRD